MKEFLDILKGNIFIKFIIFMVTLLFSWLSNGQVHEIPKYTPVDKELHQQIVKMDSIYFTAYNQCNMKVQAAIIDKDIEFFHDKGGLATSKEELLQSIKRNICGKVQRTLIEGSIEVYPIPNYGAVQIGYHKFYNNREPNAKSIPSKFITIWKKNKNNWSITRVVSLHR